MDQETRNLFQESMPRFAIYQTMANGGPGGGTRIYVEKVGTTEAMTLRVRKVIREWLCQKPEMSTNPSLKEEV